MYTRVLSLLLISILSLSHASSVVQGTIDLKRLQGILEENIKSNDITALYHAVKGLKLLNVKIPDICDHFKTIQYDNSNVEQTFYYVVTAANINCVKHLTPNIMQSPARVFDKDDATIAELYYAVYAMKAVGKGTIYDKEEGLKNLIQLLKKEDTPANYAYTFMLCEHMNGGPFTTTHAESVMLAADESDGKMLHFEGGLPVTSALISTIVRTYKQQKKPTPFTLEQRVKFSQYLLSRRSVTSARGAALLLEAALALADDEPTPIAIEIRGKKYVTSESDTIEVSVTDIVGRPYRGLKPDDVIAQSGTRLADDVVVLSKQLLTQKQNEPTTFVLNLSKIMSQYGVYKIAISAALKTTSVTVAVLGTASVPAAEVGVGDVDGTTSPKLTTVAYPNQLPSILQADHLQKISVKFSVRGASGAALSVQQAFVHIGSPGGDTEAIFVAEPDSNKAYKVELAVASMARHLGGVSGEYSVSVVVGDSALAAPVLWRLGNIALNFGDAQALGLLTPPGSVPARAPVRGPQPEIRHMFRTPEPRPPRTVSDVFAMACAAPLLLLLGLWIKLGINFSAMPLSPAVLLFHASLGGFLYLYGMLWLELNMFETLRYLLPLALVTFLSGHRLLRRLVQDKERR